MVGTHSKQKAADETVGALLRRERLHRRLTLDAVAEVLRIPPQQLRALEEGDVRVFSAEVYARGAYVNYATYLGVTDSGSYQALLRSLSGMRERAALSVPVPAGWLERMLTPYRVLLAGFGLLAALVAGYIGWQVRIFVREPRLELLAPEEAVIFASEVVVRGRTEREAHVTVNGETVLLRDDGSFEVVLPLKPGINVLQVGAAGASGSARVIRRELLVPRSSGGT